MRPGRDMRSRGYPRRRSPAVCRLIVDHETWPLAVLPRDSFTLLSFALLDGLLRERCRFLDESIEVVRVVLLSARFLVPGLSSNEAGGLHCRDMASDCTGIDSQTLGDGGLGRVWRIVPVP